MVYCLELNLLFQGKEIFDLYSNEVLRRMEWIKAKFF